MMRPIYPCDPLKDLGVGIDFVSRAVALLKQLELEGGMWVAVKVEREGWNIVRPRTQSAIIQACETEPSQ